MNDTIAAISTALGVGAISIVRLSGNDAIEIVNNCFKGKDLTKVASHTINYGHIVDKNEIIDEVLVSVMKSPKTYTTEDVVEINCHGGVISTKRILETMLTHGARLAEPGEFTKRAFLNGRIDLVKSEAVMDIIDSKSEEANKLALSQLSGTTSNMIKKFREKLKQLLASIEVNIDYPEYDDVAQLTTHDLLPKTNEWLTKIDTILNRVQTGQLLKKGIDTVIIGKPNVGKSSLLNALLEEDKAIVTDIAGTTRDIVEGQIHIGSIQLNLIDTAGIRDAKDKIEQIGIEKSQEKLKQAKLVLLVFDGSKPLDEEDKKLLELTNDKMRLIIYNKEDLSQNTDKEGIWISAQNNDIHALIDALENMYQNDLLKEEPLLSNERQIGLLNQAKQDMIRAKEAMENFIEPDLIEIDIQMAHDHLKEILGEVHREDLLDTLFSKFCLGK